ncbi:MAG: hypothetical protein ACLFPW_04170 [Spirochaetaceae bacterium]
MTFITTAQRKPPSADRPFLSLHDVRALASRSDTGPRDGFEVRTLSSLTGRAPRAACPALDALAAASAAFGRSFYRPDAPAAALRVYHRVLEVQLGHARKHFRPGMDRSREFQSFLSLAGTYLSQLRRWTHEPASGPETVRIRR